MFPPSLSFSSFFSHSYLLVALTKFFIYATEFDDMLKKRWPVSEAYNLDNNWRGNRARVQPEDRTEDIWDISFANQRWWSNGSWFMGVAWRPLSSPRFGANDRLRIISRLEGPLIFPYLFFSEKKKSITARVPDGLGRFMALDLMDCSSAE